ncbi:hypothetical protein C5167_050914, partial [Papaver somniferum]
MKLTETEVSSKVMVLKEMFKSVDDETDIDDIEESGSKVKWWIEYEKGTEDVHSPDAVIGLIDGVIKEL